MTETTAASTGVPVSIQLTGGPAVLLEIGGRRLLTDPALDAPGLVPSGDRTLTKTTGPPVAARTLLRNRDFRVGPRANPARG